MKTIKLSKNLVTIVDASDYEYLSKYKWYAKKSCSNYYAAKSKGKGLPYILMHRLLLSVPKGSVIDHINRNSLDNRKSNLRIVSIRQNNINTKAKKNKKYKGITFNKLRKKWVASIGLGSFDDPKDAAKAYDKIAKLIYGKSAFLNFK